MSQPDIPAEGRAVAGQRSDQRAHWFLGCRVHHADMLSSFDEVLETVELTIQDFWVLQQLPETFHVENWRIFRLVHEIPAVFSISFVYRSGVPVPVIHFDGFVSVHHFTRLLQSFRNLLNHLRSHLLFLCSFVTSSFSARNHCVDTGEIHCGGCFLHC